MQREFLKIIGFLITITLISNHYLYISIYIILSFMLINISLLLHYKSVINSSVNLGIIIVYFYGFLLFLLNFSLSDVRVLQFATDRNILYFYHFFGAMAVYSFVRTMEYRSIIKLIYTCVFINFIAGIFQFIDMPLSRLSFLWHEPSYHSSFYAFVLVFLLKHKHPSITFNLLGKLYIVFGLFSRSKTLVIIPIFYFFRYLISKWIISVPILIIFICMFPFLPSLNSIINEIRLSFESIYFHTRYEVIGIDTSLVTKIIHELSIYAIDALKFITNDWKELIYNNELGKPSYVERFSGMHIALISIIENPLGYGFGFFDTIFINKLQELNYTLQMQAVVTGGIENVIGSNEIYLGIQEATPKSFMLEVIFSTGIIGVVFILLIWIKIIKSSINDNIHKTAFLIVLFMSFLVETSPSLMFLTFIVASAESYSRMNEINS